MEAVGELSEQATKLLSASAQRPGRARHSALHSAVRRSHLPPCARERNGREAPRPGAWPRSSSRRRHDGAEAHETVAAVVHQKYSRCAAEQAALEAVGDGARRTLLRLLGRGARRRLCWPQARGGARRWPIRPHAARAARVAQHAAAGRRRGARRCCLLRALAHVHGRRVVHRDLSPSNVMHRADGSPCVVDFGAARTLAPGERATTLCGTPDYVAPEVLLRSGHGCEADCWSCGALLFQLVAGRAPFAAATVAELHANILAATPAPPLDEVAAAAPAAAAPRRAPRARAGGASDRRGCGRDGVGA